MDQGQNRRGEGEDMLAMVFDPAPGNGPRRFSNFRPSHATHFVAALGGEDQQPDDAAIVVIVACQPDRS
ncbi:hypothetical protein WN73_18450 [Bradyrhizobium sp. CCBAU 45394]|nr:hypothetical protein [Bradyrhizobium sp. CCBAU 45394]MDA9490162.1 hypothetical protein [Bradyrhizobium sp. CCBAU 11361]MDA9534791.1 hypothetical protein [Bradyrhizobium sp. CCBAU 21362]